MIPIIPKYPDVSFEISNKSSRYTFTETEEKEKIPIFSINDKIVLIIKLIQRELKPFKYIEIKLSFIGEIYNKLSDTKTNYFRIDNILSTEGEIQQQKVFEIPYENINTIYESFEGNLFEVKYYFKLKIKGNFLNIDKTYYKNILIKNINKNPHIIGNIRQEIGIPNKIHLELELMKNKYTLKDIITGGLLFIDIYCKITSIEIQIIRKEIIGDGEDTAENNSILGRIEICDGQPYKGDYIPFRFYLKHFNVGATIDNWAGGIQIKYYLKILIVLDTGKRLYKMQDIPLWRNDYN